MNISINITLEAGDMERLGAQLAAVWRGMALLAPASSPEPLRQAQGPVSSRNGQPVGNGPVMAEAVSTPKIVKATAVETLMLKPSSPPATNGHAAPAATNGHAAPVANSRRPQSVMPFDQYDTLVRKEMKRLGMDGRMPGRLLWEEQRDKRLPTLDAVRARYKVPTLEALATVLGIEPPLPRGKKVLISMPYEEDSPEAYLLDEKIDLADAFA